MTEPGCFSIRIDVRTVTEAQDAVDDRPKNFLTAAEIENFLRAARKGRHGSRNHAMALLAYRHGLRVSELINMRVADVDLDTSHLFVRRLKGSLSTSHSLAGDEIRALRRWIRRRANAPCCNSPLVFLSECGPMTRTPLICVPFVEFKSFSQKESPTRRSTACCADIVG
jgi:integrase